MMIFADISKRRKIMAGTNIPAGFGGLMHYNEEYDSRLKLKPTAIVIFIILIILLVAGLKIFFPISAA